MQEKAVMSVRIINSINCRIVFTEDLEIPLDISGNELAGALCQIYTDKLDPGLYHRIAGQKYNTNDILKYSIRTENPIAFIHGSKILRDYGLHDGSIINLIENGGGL